MISMSTWCICSPGFAVGPSQGDCLQCWESHPMKMVQKKEVIPTVCLDVISLVARSCGYNSDQIEQRVAHEWAVYWATQRGPAERTQHRHQQHAQPVAHVRQRQGRRPLLTPMGFPDRAPPSNEGQPWGRTRVEKRHHYSRGPHDARPTRRSSFRLLAMASPNVMLVGSD
jgi:hypothetical protein